MAGISASDYRIKRAAARRVALGQEPPAPIGEVRAFNAGYDTASPDWPLQAEPEESRTNAKPKE